MVGQLSRAMRCLRVAKDAACRGHVFVRVECQANDLARWVAPAGAIELSRPTTTMPHLRVVSAA